MRICSQRQPLLLEVGVRGLRHELDLRLSHHPCRGRLLPELATDKPWPWCIRLASAGKLPLPFLSLQLPAGRRGEVQLSNEACMVPLNESRGYRSIWAYRHYRHLSLASRLFTLSVQIFTLNHLKHVKCPYTHKFPSYRFLLMAVGSTTAAETRFLKLSVGEMVMLSNPGLQNATDVAILSYLSC